MKKIGFIIAWCLCTSVTFGDSSGIDYSSTCSIKVTPMGSRQKTMEIEVQTLGINKVKTITEYTSLNSEQELMTPFLTTNTTSLRLAKFDFSRPGTPELNANFGRVTSTVEIMQLDIEGTKPIKNVLTIGTPVAAHSNQADFHALGTLPQSAFVHNGQVPPTMEVNIDLKGNCIP